MDGFVVGHELEKFLDGIVFCRFELGVHILVFGVDDCHWCIIWFLWYGVDVGHCGV